MRLPLWLSPRARAKKDSTQKARDELFEVIMRSMPETQNTDEPFERSLRGSLDQFDEVAARKAIALLHDKDEYSDRVARMIWDAAERRDPSALLERIADNYDYIVSLGWSYAGSMPGFVLRSFPADLIEASLTTEQQHALLRLEDASWEKNFSPHGGSKSVSRIPMIEQVTDVVLACPLEIERIIDLARNRNPKSVEHYLALLDSSNSQPLREGEL